MASTSLFGCHLYATSRRFCLLLCLLIPLAGCSGTGLRVRDAGAAAARDPWTWAPLGAAAIIAATGTDERISRWAKTENPIFGSREEALDASDRYREAAVSSGWATVALTPLTRPSDGWVRDTAVDLTGSYAGVMATRNLTGALKRATQRERPHDGPTRDSFPSAHSSHAFAGATLARYHLDRMPLNRTGRSALQFATSAFAATTAWARVEGGVHYPTDVLVGAALANFTTRFFLEFSAKRDAPRWRVRTGPGGEVIIEMETNF